MVSTVPRRTSAARCRSGWYGILLGLLLCVSVGAEGAATPSAELRVGVPRVPATLDPAVGAVGPGLMVFRLVFQGLVEFGDRGEIEPALAAQWAVSRDGLTWTFRLRSDVTLHNGAPLTADDVVASLTRHLSPEESGELSTPWVPLFRGASRLVREVRRGEPGTVQILLTQAYTPLLAVLAHPALAIVVTQSGSEVPFLGTGPFRPVEHGPGRLVLEAVPGSRGEPPRTGRLVFSEVPDDPAGVAGLGPRGALDLYFAETPPAWGGLGLQVLSAPSWRVGFLALRTDQGALRQKAVRQAVAHSLDPALIHPAFRRWAAPLSSYLPPGMWGFRDIRAPGHDLVRARRLLAQAGVVDPSLTLLVPEALSGPDATRLAEAIRLSLASAGMKVRVRLEPPDATLRAIRHGEADLAVHEATLGINDPHFLLQPLLASEATAPSSGTNVAFVRSPLVDGMLLRASQLGFRPERLRLYQRLQTYLAEELPYIPMLVRLQWLLARPAVRGLRLDPGGLHRLDRAWVEVAPEPDLPVPPSPSQSPALPPAGPPEIPVPLPPVPPLPPDSGR